MENTLIAYTEADKAAVQILRALYANSAAGDTLYNARQYLQDRARYERNAAILAKTGRALAYGEINARDRAALAAVKHAATLNQAWLASSGVSIDSLPVSLTQGDIERMKRQGYLGAGWAQ